MGCINYEQDEQQGNDMNKKWTISKMINVVTTALADTKHSRYPAVEYKGFRKFATRAAARAYKQSLKNPRQYAIINIPAGMVVR